LCFLMVHKEIRNKSVEKQLSELRHHQQTESAEKHEKIVFDVKQTKRLNTNFVSSTRVNKILFILSFSILKKYLLVLPKLQRICLIFLEIIELHSVNFIA